MAANAAASSSDLMPTGTSPPLVHDADYTHHVLGHGPQLPPATVGKTGNMLSSASLPSTADANTLPVDRRGKARVAPYYSMRNPPPPLVRPTNCDVDRAKLLGYALHDYDVFVIHQGKDKLGVADAIHGKLTKRNVKAFLDFRTLPAGLSAQPMITAALASCSIAVVVCGAATHRSSFVTAEVAFALGRYASEPGFVILPVFLDDFELDNIQCRKWDCPFLDELTTITGVVQRQRTLEAVMDEICDRVAAIQSKLPAGVRSN